RLAGAVRTDEADYLALPDAEADPIDCRDVGEPGRDEGAQAAPDARRLLLGAKALAQPVHFDRVHGYVTSSWHGLQEMGVRPLLPNVGETTATAVRCHGAGIADATLVLPRWVMNRAQGLTPDVCVAVR